LFCAGKIDFDYRPYGGVVGPPAYTDRSPLPELLFYTVGVPLCALLGWLGARIALRLGRGFFPVVILCAGIIGGLSIYRPLNLPPSDAATLFRNFLVHPLALTQFALFAICAWLLSLPPRSLINLPQPIRGPLQPQRPPGEALFNYLTRFVPAFLSLLIL